MFDRRVVFERASIDLTLGYRQRVGHGLGRALDLAPLRIRHLGHSHDLVEGEVGFVDRILPLKAQRHAVLQSGAIEIGRSLGRVIHGKSALGFGNSQILVALIHRNHGIVIQNLVFFAVRIVGLQGSRDALLVDFHARIDGLIFRIGGKSFLRPAIVVCGFHYRVKVVSFAQPGYQFHIAGDVAIQDAAFLLLFVLELSRRVDIHKIVVAAIVVIHAVRGNAGFHVHRHGCKIEQGIGGESPVNAVFLDSLFAGQGLPAYDQAIASIVGNIPHKETLNRIQGLPVLILAC